MTTEEPLAKKPKTSSARQSYGRNMTEVLFPPQQLDSRPAEYPLASADWFLPSSLGAGSRLQSTVDTKHPTAAFPQTPPPSSTSPHSRDDSFPQHHQLPSTSFKGVDESMSQSHNPFESLPSQSLSQPVLSSNVRPASSSQQPQQHPPTPRSFAPIAPDPVGLQRMQAVRQSQDAEDTHQPKKRRLTQTSMDAPAPPPLKDDDKLLLQLKDEQQLPWKNIVGRFQQETGKVHAIAALQMRYKRLKDRLQVWTDPDIEALKQAHEYWESRKFDIISAKMLEFGATEKFSALACRRKWQDLHPQGEGPYFHPVTVIPGAGPGSAYSQSASPQPGHHSSAYTSVPQNTSYPHLPHPHSGIYGAISSHSPLPSQSPMHAQTNYPSHTSSAYAPQSYTSYAPVSQAPQAYRQSSPQSAHPHSSQYQGYTTPSPQQRYPSFSATSASSNPSQHPSSAQGGYGWH